MAFVRVVIQKPINGVSGGVQTVMGDGVGGTSTNVVMVFPNADQVDDSTTTNKFAIGTNTGDETTGTIQTKRPLKTVNSQSIEGTGNIDVGGVSNVYESNTITFTNTTSDYFGKKETPLTGELILDDTGAVTAGTAIVYYNNATLNIDTDVSFESGSFIPNELNQLIIVRDADGFYTLGIINEKIPFSGFYYLNVNSNDIVYGSLDNTFTIFDNQYLEMKVKFDTLATPNILAGSGSRTNTYSRITDASTFGYREHFSGSDTVALLPTLSVDTWYTIRILNNNGVDFSLFVDGLEYTGLNSALFVSAYKQFFCSNADNLVPYNTESMNGSIEYIDFNGSMMKFDNTSDTHVLGSNTMTIKSISGVDVSTLFTPIP